MKPVIEIDNDNLPRLNYRVTIHENDLVHLEIAGIKVNIVDISAKGVAFHYKGEANKDIYPMVLTFELDKLYKVASNLKIMRRKKPEYSAEFVDIDEKDVATISRLIVECQKRDIRRASSLQAEHKERSVN